MGCGGSKPAHAPTPEHVTVDGQMIEDTRGVAPPAGKAKGKVEAKSNGRGKRVGKTWQIMLDNKFQDYSEEEDRILKRAYALGQPNAKFALRGHKYEYNFKRMIQKNKDTNKERKIRPPIGPRPPKKPLLPQGPMIIITVGTGQPGQSVEVADPNNLGKKVLVVVPAHAKVGQKLAVPIPKKGESVEDVQQKQQQHDKKHGTKTSGWSTSGAVAAAGVVGAVAVGGVILGDHLAGGDMAESIGDAVVDGAEAVGDGVADAADALADWAPGAAEAAGDWVEGAGEDIGEFAFDAGEWFGDAAEDVGDFVMDLF